MLACVALGEDVNFLGWVKKTSLSRTVIDRSRLLKDASFALLCIVLVLYRVNERLKAADLLEVDLRLVTTCSASFDICAETFWWKA